MVRIPKDTELTEELLQKLLDIHKADAAEYQKRQDEYESKHDILSLPRKPKHKPDNRIVVNFCKYIVDTFNGFFIGNPVKVTADEDKVAKFVDYLDSYNDQDNKNSELSKLMSIHGKGYEMYFTDEESELCTAYLSPVEAFMVFDDSILKRPMCFVRRYTDYLGKEFGSVSDGANVRHFSITGGVKWTDEWTPHHFPGVPATEFLENAEEQSLYYPVLTNINAYNKAISEKANNVEYFSDAYLKVLGAKLDNDDLDHIKDNRIINMEGEDAAKLVVDFLSKPDGDGTEEHMLDRLERLIFHNSLVANISDDSFGTASGIALKYKVLNMLNLFQNKKQKFTSGLKRRYKLMFGHPASKVPADAWEQLDFHFTPNLPANILEEAQIAAQMDGIVSHETQLKVLSVVDSVQDELAKIEEENKAPEETVVDQGMFGKPVTGFANDESTKEGVVIEQ
jgi:SPP1 family phage portal protein